MVFVITCPFLNSSYYQFFTMPLMAIFVLATVHSANKFLKTKVLIFLGEVSFSTYLLHIIYVPLFRYNGDQTLTYIISLPLFFICTYLTSFIIYKFYEIPLKKGVKDFLLNERES